MENAEETGNAKRHCPERELCAVASKDHIAESYKMILNLTNPQLTMYFSNNF